MVFPGKARLILATTLCLGAAQPAAATPSERLSAARLHCEGSSQQLDPAWTAEVASALQPGSAACRALVAGESPTGEVKAWIEHKPRKTLSFEGLMGSSKKQATAPLAPAPAAVHVPTQIKR